MQRIYLIGSLRNPRVPVIGNELRTLGFEVFDDWFAAGEEADDRWQKYEQGRGRTYQEALAGHAANHVFHYDWVHLNNSDIVVMVLPCGKSGWMEFGYARGKQIMGYVLIEQEPERWDVMLNFANVIVHDLDTLKRVLGYKR